MKKNIILIVFALLLFGGCKKDKMVPTARVQTETPEVTTTANRATISGTYSYASTLKSVVIAYGKDASLSSPQKVTAEHTCDSYSVRINNLDPGTKYYYYCIFDTGYGASEGEQESFTTQSGGDGNHAYVDLGLPSGLLWATCNVGADSLEGYGWYFMWGSVTEGGDPDCIWANCPGNGGNNSYNSSAIAAWDATHLTNNALNPEVDAASVNWGGDWRMPTSAEWQELYDNTTSTWTTENGVYGRKCEGDNGNYVFLPAAGFRDGSSLINAGSYGRYWSSSLYASFPNYGYYLYFFSSGFYLHCHFRCNGCTVRPVCPSQSISVPTVTTSSVSSITQTTATCGGNVTSDGGAAVTARGVCWSTSQNPTVSDSHTTDGTGTGSFTSNITGLTANTTYFVRAYATNSAGTSYGEQKSFTTSQSISVPTVTTEQVSSITQTTATCGGNVTSDGGAAVTARGVCWSTSQNPTVSNSHTTDGTGTGSFTSSITGLTANTTYYVRAYATNSAGTSYGEQKIFVTSQSSGGGEINGHEYVDLGLPSGLLWATCNVGADSPEDYGNYYAWGETETKSTYNWGTYKWCNGSYNTLTKYCTDSDYGTVDNKTILDPEDDAAHVNWGGDWRMPTVDDIGELETNCFGIITTQNGVKGIRYTGPNGNSLFLPYAGAYFDFGFDGAGSDLFRWSSSLSTISPDGALGGIEFEELFCERCEGRSVRPVCPSRK